MSMVCCSPDCASPPASFSVSRDNSSSLPLGLCEDTYIKRHWNTRYYNDMGELRMKIWRDWVTCPKIKHYCLVVELRGNRAWFQPKPLATMQSKQGQCPLSDPFLCCFEVAQNSICPPLRFKLSEKNTWRVPERIPEKTVNWGRSLLTPSTLLKKKKVEYTFQNQAKVRINVHFSK